MHTKGLLALAMAAVMALGGMTAAIAQSEETAPDAVAMDRVAVQTDEIRAENIDGSEPDKEIQKQAAEAINAYRAVMDTMGEADARAKAIQALTGLYDEDSLNMTVRSWLGYLLLKNQSFGPAIDMLDDAAGRSSSSAVNLMNWKNMGAAHYLSGNYGAAAASYEKVIEAEPRNAEAHRFLGSAYLLDMQADRAITVLERAKTATSKTDPAYPSIVKDLGIAYTNAGQESNALRTFEEIEAMGASQEDGQLLAWMGFTYLQQENYDGAIRVLEKARTMGLDSPDVLTNLATAYSARKQPGDEARAVEYFNAVSEMNPNLASVWYNQGALLIKQGEYARAIMPLEKALEMAEGAGTADTGRKSIHNNLGYAYEKTGRPAEAAAQYAMASDLDPNNTVFARNAGMAYFKARDSQNALKYLERSGASDVATKKVIAELYVRNDMSEKALNLWKQIVADEPRNADIWFNMGVVHQRAGRNAEAETSYRKALEYAPNDADALNNLGIVLFELGKVDEAVEVTRKMTGTAEGSIEGKVSLAAALYRSGRKAQAIETWKEIVRADPDRADVRLNLADGLWNMDLPKDARYHYAVVLKSQPNNPRALNGMGMWHLLQTENRKAEEHFRKAISADADYLPPYNNLALALEKQNRVAQAILILKKALTIDPEFRDARDTLQRLESGNM